MPRMKIETMQSRIAQIVEALGGRPEKFEIERWSPGDGWTRYRVVRNEGSRNVTGNMRHGEFAQFLDAAHSLVFEAIADKRLQDAEEGS